MDKRAFKRLGQLLSAQGAREQSSAHALERTLTAERQHEETRNAARQTLEQTLADWRSAMTQPTYDPVLMALYAAAERRSAETVAHRENAYAKAQHETALKRQRHAGERARKRGLERRAKQLRSRLARKDEERVIAEFTTRLLLDWKHS